jgi:hypothetical protein
MPTSISARPSRCTFSYEVRYVSVDGMPFHKVNPLWKLLLYGCQSTWGMKCNKPIPCRNGSGISGLGLRKDHSRGKCPCARVDYGGISHRWCARGLHYRSAQLMRKQSTAAPGRTTTPLLLLKGRIQTRIADFYRLVKELRPLEKGSAVCLAVMRSLGPGWHEFSGFV